MSAFRQETSNEQASHCAPLRTILRLDKAHKWACYEWFYANIDQTLLGGENDFSTCLRDTFPDLKTHNLTRAEWCRIRRLLGKPRRCSPVFFAMERALLANKRQKIRQLQQQKVVDVNYYRDLPEQIPLSLVIGTRVTALLHSPHNGLYNGIIDAVDTTSHGYRITFDRPGVGTHMVPDYEVMSNDPPEFLPLNSFQTRIKPRMPILKSPRFLEILGHQVAQALGHSKDNNTSNFDPNNSLSQCLTLNNEAEDKTNSQYPIKLLAIMVRISKILSMKKKRIYELKSMNDEVERLHSLDQEVPIELKKSYAITILDIDKLNNDLDDHIKAIQIFSAELPFDINCIPDSETIKQKCYSEAKELLESIIQDYKIENETSIEMINHMLSLMFHLKSLSENDDNSLQLKALNDTMKEFKSQLAPQHMGSYEDNIEIHVNFMKKSTYKYS